MPGQKKHHTVPAFYLEGFSKGLTLTAVNVRSGYTHGISRRDATAQGYFYRDPGNPDHPNAFEDALGTVDGPAAELFARIAGGHWPLTPDERVLMSVFVALQFVRGADHRRQVHQLMTRELRRLQSESPAEFEELMRMQGAPVGIDIATEDLPSSIAVVGHLTQITTATTDLAELLLIRPWTLVRFDEPSLLTSDAPLSPVPDLNADENVGLGLENARALLFPINRYAGMQMHRPGSAQLLPGGTELVVHGHADTLVTGGDAHRQSFNMNTVMHCDERIYHHPDDAAVVPADFMTLAAAGGRIDFENAPEGLRPAP